jgi:hypothetical protein
MLKIRASQYILILNLKINIYILGGNIGLNNLTHVHFLPII